LSELPKEVYSIEVTEDSKEPKRKYFKTTEFQQEAHNSSLGKQLHAVQNMQIAADRKNERKRILELAAQEFKEPEALKISALESIAKVCKKLRMDNEYKLAMEAKKREVMM
jgi:hypothetical protein